MPVVVVAGRLLQRPRHRRCCPIAARRRCLSKHLAQGRFPSLCPDRYMGVSSGVRGVTAVISSDSSHTHHTHSRLSTHQRILMRLHGPHAPKRLLRFFFGGREAPEPEEAAPAGAPAPAPGIAAASIRWVVDTRSKRSGVLIDGWRGGNETVRPTAC